MERDCFKAPLLAMTCLQISPVVTLLLKILGWTLAHTPEICLRAISAVLGQVIFLGLPKRRHLLRSNLNHAFPGKNRAWYDRMARESCRQLIETGLLSLAAPFLSERRIRAIARLAPSVDGFARDLALHPRPVVLATLHLALWETQTWFKLLSPVPLPEFGIIFRPLNNAAADRFVKSTRERYGMRLLSRKEGFAEALKILRHQGCVGVLFDQNAGTQGALTTLFGRVCSTTELPGLLAAKFGAEVRTFYPRRTSFWRVEFESDPVTSDGSTEGVTIGLNRWLENALSADDRLCASWLWAHDRWRNQDVPQKRFRLEAKRNLLAVDLQMRAQATLPHKTRICVRLPNWLGDVVMALPILRALRESRPDAELTLIGKKQFLPLLQAWRLADHLQPLPPPGPGYFLHFWRLRQTYPDVWLLFTNSFRGDLEAWLAGCRQRFGILRPGKHRPLLTHAYPVPADFDERHHHQFELWENFLRHFGLTGAIDRSPHPLSPPATFPSPTIGLIPGSENTPEKRWPVSHWKALIAALPETRFVLFGTKNDLPITSAIAAGIAPDRVQDLAGKTDLPTYAAHLQSCSLLVTNDTGGMHLANALGVPLFALFGPTNPLRTRPVFSAPVTILQPPGCPDTGGGRLADLTPETVLAALRQALPSAGISR